MPQDLPLAEELASVYARMAGLLLSQETVTSALAVVTSLAVETIPAAVGSGVTLMDERGRRTTAGASGPVVGDADELQYHLDQGPCLSAWADRTLYRIDDMGTETRWPAWTSAVAPLGLQASLSTPLVAGDRSLGAMKVYGEQPNAFDERDERVLTMLATQAGVLIANVQSLENARRLSDQLREALRSRDVIGMAKGIVMGREAVDEQQAFAMLVTISQRENRKLREVADDVVRAVARRRR